MTEFGFIEKIKEMFAPVPANNFEGIGDDCAVFPIGNGESLVMTTDMLTEGIHFLRAATSAGELGGKALSVNLSDIAAMGATPVATLLSLSLPKNAIDRWAEEFMEGYCAMSTKYSVPLVGGDTTSSTAGITINVTAIGRVKDCCIKRRSDAQPDDIIVVSGKLGASGSGLKDILAGKYETQNALIHKNPEAQVAEGIWLGSRSEVHAMMDISDGLGSDLHHIMERSDVGVIIDTENIPAVTDVETAVNGGEDYKLLFTVAKAGFPPLADEFRKQFGKELYQIGRISDYSDGQIKWLRNGIPLNVSWKGYRHY